ncbi:MAG: DUF1566 domain-containing protein, partial [Desulfococcaceae bacterium]|nr:DUF1566 domain-containing protein [Desulfococcaceae bacterium]
QYQNLAGVHQELLKEYQASTDTFNKKLSEFKKEMQKKDEVLEEKQKQFEQKQNELLSEISLLKKKQEKKETFGKEIGRDGRFIAYDNGTVADVETKLMWTAKNDDRKNMNWYKANEYCIKYNIGGYSDWRMPSINELRTLYDINRKNDSGCFITHLIDTFCQVWSSDSNRNKTNIRYYMNFRNGEACEGKADFSGICVLPVRYIK